ncbi:MAG: nuclear transport factor 2 family protein [Bacteroidota bacterium]
MKLLQISTIAAIIQFCFIFGAPAYAKSEKTGENQAGNKAIIQKITAALELWNNSAKTRDMSHFMELFDSSHTILVVGSDSGEVFKGREQIEGWMRMLFTHRSFSWEMNRVDIDHNGNTAWVFMDGFMIVTNDKGKTAKFPYRFTGILVKVKNTWKWRLFDGSVPGGH